MPFTPTLEITVPTVRSVNPAGRAPIYPKYSLDITA
jgi:hypothetical protein